MYPMGGRHGRGMWLCVSAAVFAVAVALSVAAPAGAATEVHPAGGSTFDGGPQGWVGSGATCSQVSGTGLLCDAENVHDPAGGNPGGAIATNVAVTANLLGAFGAAGTWTSPAFTVADGTISNVAFAYDRRFDAGGLVSMAPTSEVTVELVDQESGATATLLEETLTAADSSFAPRAIGLAPATVAGGHTYRLRITTATDASEQSAGLLGESSTAFDNVRLSVTDQLAGGGGEDPELSPGTTIVEGPLTIVEIVNLIGRFSPNAEVGRGPGGSLVPLELCTIVGTPGDDRIVGTRGHDVICGLGGDDTIEGAGGRDIVDGGNGDDRLTGGNGGDLLLGLRGHDSLGGGAGHDRAGGGAGRDYLNGGKGSDRLSGGSGADRVNGAAGRDLVVGRGGPDRMNGGPGPDRMRGGRGADVINGRSGRDRISGGPGSDTIVARDGNRDRIRVRIARGRALDRVRADRRDRILHVTARDRR